VTPSFNTGRFIEQTIRSVLDQDYRHIEYIIMDAESTDDTREIVFRYGNRLRFESRKDSGQAAAVNNGFQAGSGQLFSFLNADDVYRPGAISAMVEAFRRFPTAGVIYGEADWIDERSGIIGRYPTAAYDFDRFQSECFICQPAAFLRSDVFAAVNGLNPELRFALDYDLWIRTGRRFPFIRIDTVIAGSRMHRGNKTLGRRSASFHENLNVVRKHFEYVPIEMIYGFCASLLSREDLFFETPGPSRAANLLSIFAGLYFNRAHPIRFLDAVARLTVRRFLPARADSK
jgi:glycosyltransferase involved in cell wall biosynthesis